ncbi:hypothetical protein [Noviherbaspirillum sp. ST9]|uniref:hypothetical protein n=1 Tax=Noviherbaspirillum sp. ST9 TaxID=3401606 RepID=UPI003B5874C0
MKKSRSTKGRAATAAHEQNNVVKEKVQFLFLVGETKQKPFDYFRFNYHNRFFEQAEAAADEVVVTSWNNLVVIEGHVFARRGFILKNGQEIQITAPHLVRPDYVYEHKNDVDSPSTEVNAHNVDVMSYLIKHDVISSNNACGMTITNKYALHLRNTVWKKGYLSFYSVMTYVGKWYLEECFQYAESQGIKVSRPRTRLRGKAALINELPELVTTGPIIVKPYLDANSRGIHVIDRTNCESVIRELEANGDQWYVAQEFISDSVLYKGAHKADLRFLVGVFSWEPLKFTMYGRGAPRISNKVYNANETPDREACITVVSMQSGQIDHNITTDEYLDGIEEDKELLFKKIEKEIGNALSAIWVGRHILDNFLMPDERAENTVLLLSFDIILRYTETGIQPFILETGFAPGLYRSSYIENSEVFNKILDTTYQQFFRDVRQHAEEQAKALDSPVLAVSLPQDAG